MNIPTLHKLASDTGYSEPHICRVLNGNTTPSWECAKAIAQSLGVSLDQLANHLDQDYQINTTVNQNPLLLKMRLWPLGYDDVADHQAPLENYA